MWGRAKRSSVALAVLLVSASVAVLPVVAAPPSSANANGVAFTVSEVPGSGYAPGAPVVALTFDDGPSGAITPGVLDVLRSKGANATFFTLGSEISKRPDLAQRAVAEGNSVQAHTWSHVDLTKLPADQWGAQVDNDVAYTAAVTGAPVTCLRPPYGRWNASVASRLLARGLTPLMWDDDPGDTKGNSTAEIVSEAVGTAHAGSIIILHDAATKAATLAALPAIIDGVRAKGLRIVTLCSKPPPPPIQVRDVATFGAGAGYVLSGDGVLHEFGGAPARQGPRFGADLARRVVLRSNGTSGYVLDAYGGLHPFGGAPAVASPAAWPGADMARGVALRANGKSGWVLDAWGGVHPFGGAPAATGAPYWRGWDIARAVVATSDTAGYVLDGWGVLHPFGGAPVLAGLPGTPGSDQWRSVIMGFDDRSGYVLDEFGGLKAFGQAPRKTRNGPWPGADAARGVGLFDDGISGVVVDRLGRLSGFRGAPRTVGVAVGADGQHGYALDAFGKLHPLGGAPTTGPPLWPGWEIARAVAVRADGVSGYVLDGLRRPSSVRRCARGPRRRVLVRLGHRAWSRAPRGWCLRLRARRLRRPSSVRRCARGPRRRVLVRLGHRAGDHAPSRWCLRLRARRLGRRAPVRRCTRGDRCALLAGFGHRDRADDARRRARMGARRTGRRASDQRRRSAPRPSALADRSGRDRTLGGQHRSPASSASA